MENDFLSYSEFKEKLQQQISEYLPESLKNSKIDIMTVPKEGGHSPDGLTIREPGTQIAPILYLNQFYYDYISTSEPFEITLQKITSQYMDCLKQAREMEAFNEVANKPDVDRIIFHLVNKESNGSYLKDKVYDQVGEFAAVYKIYLCENASLPITEDYFASKVAPLGIKREELFGVASENVSRIFPPVFMLMEQYMEQKMGIPLSAQSGLYILTNSEGNWGANLLFDQNIMSKAEKQLGENFCVIPSSVHEVLMFKADPVITAKEGDALIQQVNREQVSTDEQLSNHLYVFNSKERKLEMATDYENRKNEKTKAITHHNYRRH